MITILVIAFLIWLGYEIWRAPLIREDEAGNIIIITGTKKLRELFKRK